VKSTKGTSDFRQRGQPERGKSRAAQGENVTMQYIEDKDGNAVDGHRASKIREVARSIWAQLAGVGKAPKSWKQADISAAEHYRRELRRNFQELELCELDWKADQIAIEHYPSWCHNHSKDDTALKEESARSPHAKRASGHNDPKTQVAKKKKVESTTSHVQATGAAAESTKEDHVVLSKMNALTGADKTEGAGKAITQIQALKVCHS